MLLSEYVPSPKRILLAATLALAACDDREPPVAPPIAAVQTRVQAGNEKISEDAAKADKAKAAADARAAEEARAEAERAAQVEALKSNAPAYEAGFATAATAFKEALQKGDHDLDEFVEEKVKAFKVACTTENLKGGDVSVAGGRSRLLDEFVQTIKSPTFTYPLYGATVNVQFYGAIATEWTDYLWKSIARNVRQDSDFATDFVPEGDSDAIPGPRATVMVKGKNTYKFEIYSSFNSHGGTDSLDVAFGANSQEPQEMELLENSQMSAFADTTSSEGMPGSYTDAYSCVYNPTKDSAVHNDEGEATVPDRFDGIWPVQNAFR